tara:strand:+ start:45429 stop:47312 length:1884 start_codon:yes stop_codon:yes gene_type:complete
MQKFIHDNFELDLSNYQINRVEENQWFSDQFFTKYTFPFEIKVTDELNVALGLILEYNVDEPVTYYEGYLFIDGGHYSAVLEIVEIKGRTATIEISYGFDEFPSFEKKLSELPLEKATLAESLFEHAEDVIVETWPAVNYNFVQVHTDSFDATSEEWQGFENIINNYKDGAFLLNEFDIEENITYNRNIMIPMPYVLHVLMKGFEDAGYTLRGDVLTDPDIMKMLFFRETEEYVNARIEGEEFVRATDTYLETIRNKYRYNWGLSSVTTTLGVYYYEYTFPYKGRYKIAGNFYLRRERSDAWGTIFYKGANLWDRYEDEFGLGERKYSEKIKTVEFTVDVDDLSQKLIIRSRQIPYSRPNDVQVPDGPLVDLTITPLAIYDASGDLIPPLITSSKIDLTKCVPDTTFGNLVKALKNWKNLDLKIKGKDIYMNYIEPQMEDRTATDFSEFNTEEPYRKPKQGTSFLLQFRELDSEFYNPLPVFVSIKGVQNGGYTKNEKTQEITIDAVPLPNVTRNGINTALAVDKGESAMCMVLYEGAPAQLNLAEDNSSILLPAVLESHWKKWLDFRIKSESFIADFNAIKEKLRGITTESKVFMYNNFHIIKVLSKTNIPGTDIYEVEMELEKLK